MPLTTIHCVLILVLCLGLACQASAQRGNVDDLVRLYEARVHESDDGGRLPYRLLVPENYDPNERYPLVLFLHGAGERGEDNRRQLVWGADMFTDAATREAFPAFVVVPQCPENRTWSAPDLRELRRRQSEEPTPQTRAVLEIIAQLEQEYAIDASRRYVMGLSMGGYGTWDLITREPEMFAAAVPICGGGDVEAAGRAATVPVWAFHSSDDNVVPVEQTRAMVRALRDAGGRAVTYTEYADAGHASWVPAFENAGLLPWLFSQRRE